MAENSHTITGLLEQWRGGNQQAGAELMELVYDDLHKVAAQEMRRERGEHTLQTTALVHETYLRLCSSSPAQWNDRAHFFAVAAQQIRRVLVEHARRLQAEKRGGGQIRLSLWDSDGPVCRLDEQFLSLNEALDVLQTLDARAGKVIELRFFGGLSESEAAKVLGISVATLKRDWDFARSWLATRLGPDPRMDH